MASGDIGLAKDWKNVLLGTVVGVGITAASAYYLHLQYLHALEKKLGRKPGGAAWDPLEDDRQWRSRSKGRSPSRRRRAAPNNNVAALEVLDLRATSPPPRLPQRNVAELPQNHHLEALQASLPHVAVRPTPPPGGLPAVGLSRMPPQLRPSTPKSPPGAFHSLEVTDEELEGDDEGEPGTDVEGLPEEEDKEGGEEEEEEEQRQRAARLVRENGLGGAHAGAEGAGLEASGEAAAEGGAAAAGGMVRTQSISTDLHLKGHAPDPVAADILRREPEHETFVRLNIGPIEAPSSEELYVCALLANALALRKKYVFRHETPVWHSNPIEDPTTPKANQYPFHYEPEEPTQQVFAMRDGVVHVYANKDATEELYPVPDATEFFTDMHMVLKDISLGAVRTHCHHRLRLLEQKFSLHLMLNADLEFMAQKSAPHRDFYNVRKVDTHIHHSSCMNQKHLLRFIKSKLRKEPHEVVIYRDGTYLTLAEVFKSLDLTGYDLNVDLLDVHADKNTFHRFDKFNLKYNPCGQSRLREIFLKQDNLIQGRFLAELTKEVFDDMVGSKYQMAEYRISIYGRKKSEWDQLASWIVNNKLYCENVVWLIQLPRLYNVYKEMGIVQSFQTMLDNIFLPLFEVTVDPSTHPQLHVFLRMVVGFDMVDDESKPERRPTKHMPIPSQWNIKYNPAYSYWAYYCYANLHVLNKLREAKGYSVLKFRPHAGEAGDIDHLVSTFLLADSIAHGNNLRKAPALQYLYYLAQIGLAMSPLSNNSLFLDYHRNPFPMFFARGLNVSLSTDDPLQIHLTKEPLVEEYSIAAQVWKFSPCDLCEIARNSVYQSGFSHASKSHWIGPKYYYLGPNGNDIHKTNVPHIRLEFRHDVWTEELRYVCGPDAEIPDKIDC